MATWLNTNYTKWVDGSIRARPAYSVLTYGLGLGFVLGLRVRVRVWVMVHIMYYYVMDPYTAIVLTK